jgi:hypothetical protein
MQTINIVNKQLCNFASCVRVAERNKMCILTELVNNYQDAVVAPGLGQAINEIHSSYLPWCRWNRERLQ